MKVKSISLSWFRGAANSVTLETGMKNTVVYGSNGSGKSSFADALEYIIARKILHLQHEYSGKQQEKGILNTHKPSKQDAVITITLDTPLQLAAKIASDGSPSFSSTPKGLIDVVQTWRPEQLLLRQNEVSDFVNDTKGGKYSVLLPLLGLSNFECAADNISKLNALVTQISLIDSKKWQLTEANAKVAKYFSDTKDATVIQKLKAIAGDYGIEIDSYPSVEQLLDALHAVLMAMVNSMTPEITIYTLLKQIHELDLPKILSSAMKKQAQIQGKIDRLLDNRIQVLLEAQQYLTNVAPDTHSIECPACGQTITRTQFQKHVETELTSLNTLCSGRDAAKEARKKLKDSIDQTLANLSDENILALLKKKTNAGLKVTVEKLSSFNATTWHNQFTTADQILLSSLIEPIASFAKEVVNKAPPSNAKLMEDLEIIATTKTIPQMRRLETEVSSINLITDGLVKAEADIRKAIRSKTKAMITVITKDIQGLWSKIHPQEPIESITLYLPEDADKSIDISLKFFGISQPSPRLTLSEGHRNSLGLCIFLALARLPINADKPIFLDDIVSSLDRGHRNNVTKLLLNDFGERQILLFTHDRDWFQELKIELPSKTWKKMVVKPWQSPSVGIQWSESEDTYDDARALMPISCEAAGNCVRGIMDTQLSIMAEKLRIKMPYLRGDKNDFRTCVSFLNSIISESPSRLKKKEGTAWNQYDEPIQHWKRANELLIAFADRSSHGGSLVPGELDDLIQACEVATSKFKCPDCGQYFWIADQANKEVLQCNCGNMHWKYG